MEKINYSKFYASLGALFLRAQRNYESYINNGKTYGLALAIYRSNKEICSLLIANAIYVPKEDGEDVTQLLCHYDGWFSQFEILEKTYIHNFNSPFVFQREQGVSAFPLKYQSKVLNIYEEMLSVNR